MRKHNLHVVFTSYAYQKKVAMRFIFKVYKLNQSVKRAYISGLTCVR